jgi:hypothetical protein
VKIALAILIIIGVGLCVGPFLGFNKLPSGPDEEHKN